MNEREKYLRALCAEKKLSADRTDAIVKKALAEDADEDTKALVEVLDVPLGRIADYNRSKDALKSLDAQLRTWESGAKSTLQTAIAEKRELERKVAEYEAKYGKPNDGDDDTAKGKGDATVDMQKIEQLINQRDGYYLALMADQNAVIARHAQMFKGEVIDTTPLLRKVAEAANDQTNPRQISLVEAYNEVYKDRIETHNAEVKSAEEKRLKDEGAKEERARLMKAGMRPTGAAVAETGSVFHAISTADKKDDPDRARSEDDNLAMFAQDLAAEMAKVNQAEA